MSYNNYFTNAKTICEEAPKDESDSIEFVASKVYAPTTKYVESLNIQIPVNHNSPDCGKAKEQKNYLSLSYGSERREWIYWPWVVKIFVSNEYVCTGNLISKSFVLTAAHCVSREDVIKRRVQIGIFTNQSKLSFFI